MNLQNIKSPGVYIDEQNAFPNSIVPIATAVPAFIGYTPQAEYQGQSYLKVPTKITSFADFQAFFCYPNADPPTPPAKQYSPDYYLVEQDSKPDKGKYMSINGSFYSILPDPATIYYMYTSVQLFFQNGGGEAYIVSVGSYGEPSGKPTDPGAQIVNPNVTLGDLQEGLELLKNESEPTMYLCPEATLLSTDENGTLMQAMMAQSADMMTSVSIFDIIGGNDPDPLLYTNDIEAFRTALGNNNLDFGTAYYPFVNTTIMQSNDIDYTNVFGGDVKQLEPLLSPASNPDPAVASVIASITAGSDLTVTQNNNALISSSILYQSIMKYILEEINTLPPSAGMAGIITATDNNVGPWKAPANTSMISAVDLPIYLTEAQQGGLNMDAVSGKSINAIRFFNGLGILVWGARTLDGNSLDWKYLSVRRTMIFLEQSCKVAAQAYVFEPNNKNTWEAVKAMIGSFLTSVWKQGGLQGATAADAFSVECGLGSTMTGEDILLGFMKVTVKVAVTRPAEFIVLTFSQQMVQSS